MDHLIRKSFVDSSFFIKLWRDLQGDQLYMAVPVCFWYQLVIKRELFSVRVYSSVHWTCNFVQGTSKTRPCLSVQVIFQLLRDPFFRIFIRNNCSGIYNVRVRVHLSLFYLWLFIVAVFYAFTWPENCFFFFFRQDCMKS